ncbi:MAG: hypothetical protein SFY32_06220 [Bacteroidota bacterium]|nr:hypothetical protein [Bacteroidota bacterium]
MNQDDYLKRLVEIMSEMLHEQRVTNERLGKVEYAIEKLEDQQAKTNLGIGELRVSFMRLATEIEVIHKHDIRISELEKKVFA